MNFFAAALIGLLLLASCQTTDPPPGESILRLKLADSLSRYENVIVDLVDPVDTNRILENVWTGTLSEPGKLSGHPLVAAKGKDFIVKVRGFAGGNQLFLQTLIAYIGGKKSVTYSAVPPYKPRNKLKNIVPSVGILSPRFLTDSTRYSILLPEGASSIRLTITPDFNEAKILVDGEALTSGTPSNPIAIGTNPDTIKILVTDSSQSIPYTLEYDVILLPSLPSKGRLASLTPSIGVLTPTFNPDSTVYSLYFPDTVTSITLTMRSTDPTSMTMILNSRVVFEGIPSPPITISPKGPGAVAMEVRRGQESTNYLIYMFFNP